MRAIPLSVVLIALHFAASVPPVAAQESSGAEASAVLETLQGEWEGSGVLLGRPAEFEMCWQVGDRGFVRLTYRNLWIDDGGSTTPVLSAQATYLVRDRSAIGVWLDDRPQRLTIDAVVTDSSFISNWTADTEEGRTEYVIRSPETVVVRDFVFSGGVEQLFAEAEYERARSGRDPTSWCE